MDKAGRVTGGATSHGNPGKYLVIGPSWIGDMVMAQSLFRQLKAADPRNEIAVIAPSWTRPLLDRMPEVSESLDSPFRRGKLNWLSRRRFGRELRGRDFTHAIVLPNSFKSALTPFHAGIPERVGWRGEWRDPLLTDCRRLDKRKFPLMVQRFVALAFPADHPPVEEWPNPELQVRPDELELACRRLELNRERPVLALCPGAEYGPSKQWPATGHIELANLYLRRDWQVWLFGSTNDRAIAAEITAGLEPGLAAGCRDLTGRTKLAEAVDLLSAATVVVSNDSGLMHVAAALNKPLAAIYGSSSPEFTPPLSGKVELLATGIECQPCYRRECPYGHLRCLTGMQPAKVAGAIDRLREESSGEAANCGFS
ncbi:MAG: lipopolysaccharide heptosyltransferase II [Gammaproteobacteria bacterium]|nr:lipopolysaccharide heptosyltransferase II [Gammaproteobacteria bacterium]